MNDKWINFNKPTISKKDLIHVLEGMIMDQVGEGRITKKFEHLFARYLGAKDAVIVSTTSAALYLIFKHIHLKKGEEVILLACSDPFILDIIKAFDAVPVFVDVKDTSYQMDLSKVKEKINKKTKAVIVSHLFGFPVDLSTFDKGEEKNWCLIEDCSHALGAFIADAHVGHFGDYAFFSFNENSLITAGQGGAVITKEKKNILEIRDLKKYEDQAELKGRIDFSFTDLQAALGISELSLIDKFLARRQEIADFYQNACQKGKNRYIPASDKAKANHEFFPLQISSSLKISKELFKKYKVEIRSPFSRLAFELGRRS